MAKRKAFSGRTSIFFVLDRSGSMNAVRDATISGFNEWLHDVQRTDSDALFTLSLFSTTVEVPIAAASLKDVADLDHSRYAPDGMTALYDAIARAVRSGERDVDKKDRALVVVMTDGQENSSREVTREALNSLITEHEKQGNWTFTYLSAHPDAFAESAALGIRAGNVARYANTQVGTQSALRNASASTQNFIGGASASVESFYQQPEGKAAKHLVTKE